MHLLCRNVNIFNIFFFSRASSLLWLFILNILIFRYFPSGNSSLSLVYLPKLFKYESCQLYGLVLFQYLCVSQGFCSWRAKVKRNLRTSYRVCFLYWVKIPIFEILQFQMARLRNPSGATSVTEAKKEKGEEKGKCQQTGKKNIRELHPLSFASILKDIGCSDMM